MSVKNIFSGEELRPKYARGVYEVLMKREWCSSLDFAEHIEGNRPQNVEASMHKSVLKHAVQDVLNELNKDEELVIKEGTNRNLRYKYIGKNPDPLIILKKDVIQKNLDDFSRFCLDSTGFFPYSWFEHFFKGTYELLEYKMTKQVGKQLISSGLETNQNNIALLPFIYECIRDRKVLQISYCPKFEEEKEVLFHPHFLKEYNYRWHIFGYADGKSEGYDIPLDRISKAPIVRDDVLFVKPQEIKYPNFFDDIIGTTHKEELEISDIVFRVYDKYIFGLFDSRKIHQSQRVFSPYDDNKGYGDFSLRLCPNSEFYGTILRYGSDVEIIKPINIRNTINCIISKMFEHYNKQNDE